jgi:hypothetical protein
MTKARPDGAPGSALTGPTREQRRVLDALVEHPNAAAVARALGVSERNVRRIRDRFSEELQERWRRRDEEGRALADARRYRIEAWLDASLDRAMDELDALLTSANESIRLRAAKTRIDLALRFEHRGVAGLSMPLDDLAAAHAEELRERIRGLAEGDPPRGS